MAVQTQWRVHFGTVLGLDYAAVAVVMDMRGVADRRALFDDLQVMERAALKVMRAKNGS